MLVDEIRQAAKHRSVSEEVVRQEKLRSCPMGRFATPSDIANAVVFLVSDESRHVSGEFVKVNGGK